MKISKKSLESLQSSYKGRKGKIEERLAYFKRVGALPPEKLFEEFAFCILTPQSKARVCDAAVRRLAGKGLLHSGEPHEIIPHLAGVRFPIKKSGYLVQSRGEFAGIMQKVSSAKSDFEARDYLAENVLGFGYKEAGHFLRNIGMARNIAILDRHILKNLKLHGAIKKVPKSLGKREYLEIEKKMQGFAGKIGIDLQHVDLLFWSEETGEVFK